MKLRVLLAVVSLFLSLAISADHKLNECAGCWIAVALTPAVDETLGVNVHFIDPQPGEVKMIASAGFRWVRTDLKWELTERQRGKYDFSPYDGLLKELDAFNIRALFILDYGNPLYTEGKSVRTPAARKAFVSWAIAAAKHFSGRGAVWEIFNEPNTAMFWPPRPNVDEYQALASEVGRAFRASVPDELLIGPATSKIDLHFLDSCFKSKLMQDWFAVSFHPYRQTAPETAASEYARLREMIRSYDFTGSQSRFPLVSSEWGYSSAWSRMDEENQAVMLTREFLTNVANGIQISIWYDWREGTDPNEPEDHFGLVRNAYRRGQDPAYDPKPAYFAAKTLTKVLGGYRYRQRLNVGGDDDYVLVFVKDGESRFVAWTSSPLVSHVTVNNVTGDYAVVGAKGESAGVIGSKTGGLYLELTTAPKYLIPIP
ncbi:MAG: cellulase family glycosylhydrolase [Pyrinomonadaceae bacterium]